MVTEPGRAERIGDKARCVSNQDGALQRERHRLRQTPGEGFVMRAGQAVQRPIRSIPVADASSRHHVGDRDRPIRSQWLTGRAVIGKTLGDNWSNRGYDYRHSDVSAMQHRRSPKILAPAHLAVGVSGAMLLLRAAESASVKGGSPSFYLNSFSLSENVGASHRRSHTRATVLRESAGHIMAPESAARLQSVAAAFARRLRSAAFALPFIETGHRVGTNSQRRRCTPAHCH
jgi:hypothetical protein